jgi:HK97 family phage major capsid protein
MRKSLELRQKADAVAKEAKAILAKLDKEKKDPTDEIRAQIDGMTAQIDQLVADAKRYEQIENFEAGRAASPETPEPQLDDAAEEKPKKTAKVFPTLGHQLEAIFVATTGKAGKTLSREEARNKLMAAASGAGEVIDSEGGYMLQQDFAQDLEKEMFATGSLLSFFRPLEVSSSLGLVEKYIEETSRATGSRWGGVRAFFVEEAEAPTATKPKFRKRTTELVKLACLGYSTDELLDDFVAMSGVFAEAFRDEMTFTAENALFAGDGAGKLLGMFASGNAGHITVSKETGQAAATVVTKNLSKMWVRLPSRSKARGVWAINTEVNPELDELTIPAGTAAVEPRFVTYDQQGALRIKGRPVIELEYCEALGTENDVVLFDPNGYRLIRRGGITQASSMHVKFTTDEMTFRATWRIGGQPKLNSAITAFKGSASLSHFINLETRA